MRDALTHKHLPDAQLGHHLVMPSVVLLLGNRVKSRLNMPDGLLLLPDRRHLKRVKFTALL